MLNILVFSIFLGFSNCFSLYDYKNEQLLPEPPDCGTVQHLTKRLYGGAPINVTHIPWMVGLEIEKESSEENTSVVCGGTLINSRYVLTAAHCIEDDTIVSVILGTTNARHVGKRIKVEKSVSHGDYQSYEEDVVFKGENDIALIRLAEEVKYTKYIQPICLPFSVPGYYPPTNETDLTIAGWGKRRYTSVNDILEFVEIPFFSFDDCERIYEQHGRDLTANSLCAGGVPGESFCNMDGGGPLMSQIGGEWILDGIVTKTTEDGCASKTPGVFVNVLKYERWIKEHIVHGWKSSEDNRQYEKADNGLNHPSPFWLLIIVLISILTLIFTCCLLTKMYWKTHKACITATYITVFLTIVGGMFLYSYLA